MEEIIDQLFALYRHCFYLIGRNVCVSIGSWLIISKMNNSQSGHLPFYRKMSENIFHVSKKATHDRLYSSIGSAITKSRVLFYCVGVTPQVG